MDAPCRLAGGVEATDHLAAGTQRLGSIIDSHPPHAVVDHRRHNGNMEGVAGLQGEVVEELLAPLVPGLAATIGLVGAVLRVLFLLLGKGVVLVESGLDVGKGDAVLLRKLTHVGIGLHDAAALVVLAMPRDLSGGLAIEAQEEAGGVAQRHPFVLPHHACDVVTAAELVAEAVPFHVQQHAAHTSQGLRCEELDLGVRILGVHQAGGVDLDPLEVNALTANRHGHLQAVACAVVPVGRRQVRQVRAVLVQQRV
mmetsp:Transcript_54681/g.171685  ORF Transcript_54681/g.171685 Transcript_54681/m.171685 type:complete len:254 (-) Transcript_54681:668-1429(-)